ncbi:MAG TPA: hypothetical protein VG937_04650 [Polyangiaceae bacterium]|nr:hypothetical protein [Polyangiaceae bacterium]
MNHPPMTLARFRTLVEAYGGELSRWPEKERGAAKVLLESSEPARAALAEEVELDRALDALSAPDLSPALARRLNEIPIRAPAKSRRLPFKRLWAPALAWAAAAAIGIALGNFADDEDDTLADAGQVSEAVSPEPAPSDNALASLALGFADLEEIQ